MRKNGEGQKYDDITPFNGTVGKLNAEIEAGNQVR